jgi:hypothetical protein
MRGGKDAGTWLVARTRGELVATVFFGEHLPRIQRHVGVGDDASFVDAPRPRT